MASTSVDFEIENDHGSFRSDHPALLPQDLPRIVIDAILPAWERNQHSGRKEGEGKRPTHFLFRENDG